MVVSSKLGNIVPLYLIYGTETFLMNEWKDSIISNALTEEDTDFNLSQYDLEETPIELAIEDAETLPFLGEKKVVVLKNPVFLTSDKTKEKVEHNVKVLEKYLESPSPYSVMIFIANYEKLDERKKITKLLKKNAKVFEAKKLNDDELKNWIKEKVGKDSFAITDEAVELLISLVGPNLTMIFQEIEKLKLFLNEGTIYPETVHNLVSKSLEQNVFTLVDFVVKKDIKKAIELYHELLKVNEDPIKLVAIIANQFRMIYQTKAYLQKGYSTQQIASYLKVHPFRIKLAAQQSKSFSHEELLTIMNDLADADYALKTGKGKREYILEMFLLKLSQK